MANLSPTDAANAAVLVYKSKSDPKKIARFAEAIPGLNDNFDFENLSNFKSKSGAFFKVKSGYGFIAQGKGQKFGNDTLVAIRGTASLADALTDLNTGIQVTSTGKIVHAGFNRTFKDIEAHLSNHLRPGGTVHFCGHSLGGALATLGADWVSQKKSADAKLYTFGSPRVGFKPFSDRLTTGIGADNIFRVHRSTDVVPMVPIWPFVHVPQPGVSYRLPSQGRYSPGAAHSSDNYLKSMSEYRSWNDLITPDEISSLGDQAVDWLSLDGVKVLGSSTLNLLGRAIGYILKAAGVVIQVGAIAACSVLDMLSLALEKAARVSVELGGLVTRLLKKILSLTGFVVGKTIDLTRAFIRWAFQLLSSAIGRMVNLALMTG